MVSQARKIRKENKDKARRPPAPLPGENPTRSLRRRPTLWATRLGPVQAAAPVLGPGEALSTQPGKAIPLFTWPLWSVFKPRHWGLISQKQVLTAGFPRRNSGIWVPSWLWVAGPRVGSGGGGVCPSCPLLGAFPLICPVWKCHSAFVLGVFFRGKFSSENLPA